MLYPEQRAQLYRTVLKLYQKDLIQLSSGNVSLRVSPEHLLITPAAVPYDDLTPEDLVIIDLQGNLVEGAYAPSSEAPMHTCLHREMPDIAAVIHTHSAYALAFAVVGVGVPVISTESLTARGPLPVAEYACPGTEAQGRVALRAMQGPPQVMGTLLRNHGVLAVGPSLSHAFSIAYQIEMAARTYFLALQIGRPTELTDAQIDEIRVTYAAKKSAAESMPAAAPVETPKRT